MAAMPGQANSHGTARSVAPRRVVAGIDDTPGGLAALRYAIELAQEHRVPLVAVRAWALGLPRHGGRRWCHDSSRGHVALVFGGSQARQAATVLTRRALCTAGGVPADLAVRVETPEGNPGQVLTEFAGAEDVLVVGATPAWSVNHAVHGSVSAYCERHSRCPVIIVKPSGPHGPGAPEGWSTRTAAPALPLYR